MGLLIIIEIIKIWQSEMIEWKVKEILLIGRVK